MGTLSRKYTNTTFEQIVADMVKILRNKQGALADLSENSYGRTLIELFAGNADLTAAWGENIFQESFLETAKLYPSIYAGSRMLGYSIRRPIPARAGFAIQLKRTGMYPTARVVIPRGTTFTFSGSVLTCIDDTEWAYDRNQPDFEDGFFRLVSGRAILAQGGYKSTQFFSSGDKNQVFTISDPTFSNWFGDQDPNWIDPSTQSARSLFYTSISTDAGLLDDTQVDTYGDKILWRISRRGLFDPFLDDIYKNNVSIGISDQVTNNYTALIDTANDGNPRLTFGDGIISAIPYGNILVSYFSTLGELGNQTNVAGQSINPGANRILISQYDGTQSDLLISDISFALTTDISSGQSLEDMATIKNRASSIYSSLDSLGNGSSYIQYLRGRNGIRYASAYGEDVLSRGSMDNRVKLKYSNLVRFTLLKELYSKSSDSIYPTDPFDFYVSGYKVNGLTYIWQYDYTDLPGVVGLSNHLQVTSDVTQKINTAELKIYDSNGVLINTTDFVVNYLMPSMKPNDLSTLNVFNSNLSPRDFATPGTELDILLDDISRKGYLTLGNGQTSYEPPVVHDMSMNVDLSLFPGANFTDIKNQIKQAVYQYLMDVTDFSYPLYRSQIECIIQSMPEVAGANIKFKARKNGYENISITSNPWMSGSTATLINQSGLDANGMSVVMEYTYTKKDSSGAELPSITRQLPFTIPNQTETTNQIMTYTTAYITYLDGNTYKLRTDLTEDSLNKYCAFIWDRAYQNIVKSIYDQVYSPAFDAGDIESANAAWAVIDAIRGWYMSNGALLFKDTDSVTSLYEKTDGIVYKYFTYALEYIKFVRNVIGSQITTSLIDSDGNVTKYSGSNEIVQFVISNDDMTIRTVAKR